MTRRGSLGLLPVRETIAHVTAITLCLVMMMMMMASSAENRQRPTGPRVLTVGADSAAEDPVVRSLVDEVRSEADAFIFLVGGAAKMATADQTQLLALFEALGLMARQGTRLAVGDGGTQAGIMEAAGLARRASDQAFLLVGVVPAAEVAPRGQTALDPNHSHIVTVDNPSWNSADGWWGSETATMYQLFARLSAGRPSVAVVANGGGIALTEVEENVRAGRPIVLIAGSGRAADALVSLLMNSAPTDAEVAQLRARAAALNLTRQPGLFRILNLASATPASMAAALTAALRTPEPPIR